MFKYVFFDLDGTLTDSEEGITKSLRYALSHFGIEYPDSAMLRKFIGPSLSYSFETFCGFDKEKSRAATEKYRERFESIGLYENRLYDGIKELLEDLKKRGKVIVLATSKPLPYAKKILEYFGIYQYFDFVSGAGFEGSSLEKEDIIESAIKSLGCSGDRKSEIVMVGDRKYDIKGAKINGTSAVGVKYGFAEEGELEAAGADYIVGSVEELMELLCAN